MDGLRLDGKVALITGTSQGIGAAVAGGFCRRGAKVLLTSRAPDDSPPATLSACRAVGEAEYRRCDVRSPEECARAVAAAVDCFGGLDIVVCNAGIYPKVPFEEMTLAQWDDMLRTNLDGTFYVCHAATPHLIAKGYGKIITVGSINSRMVQAQRAHYVASKAGLIGFTRGLARDLGKYGIRANCILPGAVLTEGELRDFPDQAGILERVNQLQSIPGRIESADCEPTFAFLAHAASDPITGQALAVDNGWTFDG